MERALRLLVVLTTTACGRIGFDATDATNDTLVALDYKPVRPVYIVGYPIETIAPIVEGTATAFSIDPPLPAGLDLDPLTGLITGIPMVVQAPTIHTIIATNGELDAGTRIRIRTAEGYVVNSSADDTDAQPGDGLCATLNGNDICTLRAAAAEINQVGGAKHVVYITARTIMLGSSLPGVVDAIELVGEDTGAVIVDGGGVSALAFNAANALIALGYLTYRNSREVFHNFQLEPTLRVERVRVTGAAGFATLNATGTVSIIDSTIDSGTGNVAFLSGGTTTIARSTFTGNTANIDGMLYFVAGMGSVENCTFVGNGGMKAAVVVNNAIVEMRHNTFVDNTASEQFHGGAVTLYTGATSTWANNLFVDNQGGGGQCSSGGVLTSEGNLAWPAQMPCFAASGDLAPADPLIGPLDSNGGPTRTVALQPGSAAVDTALMTACETTDQREITRPQGAGCDVGAYEMK